MQYYIAVPTDITEVEKRAYFDLITNTNLKPKKIHVVEKPVADARSVVEWLIELGMVEGVGNGSARRYMLSSKVYSISNNTAGYIRQRGWDTLQEREMIISHFDKYSEITREGVAELCRCTLNHASWLLRQLVEDGILVLRGKGRGSRYEKA